MKKLIMLGFFIYFFQGCGSSATTNNVEVESGISGGTSICYQTFNLQVGEKATYRFNVQGDFSYMSAEVVSENNESYTIAFSEENKEVEYYQWLKGCQTFDTLKAVRENKNVEYILTGHFTIENNTSVNNSNINTQQDASVSFGTSNRTQVWLEEYIVESKVYQNVRRDITPYSNTDPIAYEESYTYLGDGVEIGNMNIPLGKYIKYTIGYWDDTNITIELIEWNGL
ncbi:MAG: hypothetical protein JXQ76_10135 [Campylobacterales bacterium]|nr:hypothetical protein [Campylobacterales bacterium]